MRGDQNENATDIFLLPRIYGFFVKTVFFKFFIAQNTRLYDEMNKKIIRVNFSQKFSFFKSDKF